jgi:hypothetical protein
MKRVFFLTALALLGFQLGFFHSAEAQQNWVPGEVVMSNLDTVSGFIDYRNWRKNPDKVLFYTNSPSDAKSYTPLDIHAFRTKDESYVAAIVDSEISPRAEGSLTSDPVMKLKRDTVFLQAILVGAKSLYFNKNVWGNDNFYIQNGDKYELLEYKKYKTTINGTRVIRENKRYTGQLTLYFEDCPDLGTKIQGSNYDRKSLESIFTSYHQHCRKTEATFIKEKENVQSSYGLLAGMTSTSVGFSVLDREFEYLLYTDYPMSNNFTGGIFYEIIFPRSQGKWSLNNELFYTSFQTEGVYEDSVSARLYKVHYSEFAYAYIQLKPMVRYSYPLGKVSIFASAGVSFGFSINGKSHYVVEKTNDGGTTISEGIAPGGKKGEQGLILGTGLRINKVSLELRFEKGNGFSNLILAGANTNRYFFLMGYRLQ